MDVQLFMECEEEELEPWQQVDDSVEEDEMDFYDNYCEPMEDSSSPLPASETPPPRTPPPIIPAPTASSPVQMVSSSVMPPPPPPPPAIITSSSSVPRLPVSTVTPAPPLMAQGQPLFLTQTAGGTFLLPAAPGSGGGHPFLLTTQGFPVMNAGTPLLLNLQPGQTVQPLTLIQSSSLSQLVRPGVGMSSVQVRPGHAPSRGPAPPGSGFTAMQLPATLTIRTGTPGPVNLQMTQVGGAKLVGSPVLPSGSASAVSRVKPPLSIAAPTPTPPLAPTSDPAKVVMSVEEFYYGTDEGNLNLRKPHPLGIKTSTFTCHICSHLADNNLRLMQHMLQHSELISGAEGDDRKCCRSCYRQFSTPAQLQSHQEQVHGPALSSCMCRICEWAFENEPAFLNHMKSNHKPGEMPYVCQVCSYRSSFYSDVLQHFASFHRDSRFLLCVFCLKVTKHPTSYQEHLLRHQINQAFHCNRCRLQFVFLKDKMQHKLENHRSIRRPAKLEGLPPGSKVTIRTYGKVRSVITSPGSQLLHSPSPLIQPINIKTEPRSPPHRNPPRSPTKRGATRRSHGHRSSSLDGERLVCLECGTEASDFSAHYPTHVHCLLCPYSSCCSRAYAAHMIHHHVPQSRGPALPLHRQHPPCRFLLQCSECDFRPQSADLMADHLLKHPDHSATCQTRERKKQIFTVSEKVEELLTKRDDGTAETAKIPKTEEEEEDDDPIKAEPPDSDHGDASLVPHAAIKHEEEEEEEEDDDDDDDDDEEDEDDDDEEEEEEEKPDVGSSSVTAPPSLSVPQLPVLESMPLKHGDEDKDHDDDDDDDEDNNDDGDDDEDDDDDDDDDDADDDDYDDDDYDDDDDDVARPKKRSRVGPLRGNEYEGERWRNSEDSDLRPNPIRFLPARQPGPTLDPSASPSPLSLFQLFFSASVVRTIITNTNANAAMRLQAGLKIVWKPLTVSDFYIFLAIVIFSGLAKVNEGRDYWRKERPYHFPFPSDTMTRDRFESILRMLHLSDPAGDERNDRKRNTAGYDRLFKIKPLYTQIAKACKAHFQPHQNIAIHERMVTSKLRINVKQYTKAKPTRWGYKIFVLADSSTAYSWNLFVYQGKSVQAPGQGLNSTSVLDLLSFPQLGRGYTLFFDSSDSSPALFEELSRRNIGACGTIRKKQIGFPKTKHNDLPGSAKRGDMRWIRRNKLLFVKWMDTQVATICSTVHKAFSEQTVMRRVKEDGVWQCKTVPIPDPVLDYHQSMDGVGVFDALTGYYSVYYKTMKWYQTFLYHFMDIAVVNSFLLHKELFKKKLPMTQKSFREKLAAEMFEFAKDPVSPPPTPPSPSPASSPASPPTPTPTPTPKPTPKPTPPPAPASTSCVPAYHGDNGTQWRKYCRRCQDSGVKRMKTPLFCMKCQVSLCFTPKRNCFKDWHECAKAPTSPKPPSPSSLLPAPAPAPLSCVPMYYGDDGTQSRRYCKRCYNAGIKRMKTPVYCLKCQVSLCLTSKRNCFMDWHSS